MNYEIQATQKLKEEISKFSPKTKKIIYSKITLLKINPYRFKRLKNTEFFRIRFADQRIEKRLIYKIKKSTIILLLITDRKKNYKELEFLAL